LKTPDFESISKIRNREEKKINFYTDRDTTLRNFYYYNRNADAKMFQEMAQQRIEGNKDKENYSKWADKNLYELTFSNEGGMLMPIIVEWTFVNGSKEVDRIRVTIWRLNENRVSKVFVKNKEVKSIQLDPMKENADIDEANGKWPVKEMPSKF
jgi:hypothetical protein